MCLTSDLWGKPVCSYQTIKDQKGGCKTGSGAERLREPRDIGVEGSSLDLFWVLGR